MSIIIHRLFFVLIIISFLNCLKSLDSFDEIPKQTPNKINIYDNKKEENYIKSTYDLSSNTNNLVQNNEVIIRILKEVNNNTIRIGYYGIIFFVTDFNNNETNIFDYTEMEKENIKFKANISDTYNNQYEVNCRFWQPKDEKARLFCKLIKRYLKYTRQNIILNELQLFYNNHKIIIQQNDYIVVEQYVYNIPFLYSDKVERNVILFGDKYNFKFKIESYHNETLYIYGKKNYNYGLFDNCKVEDNNILSCDILAFDNLKNFMTCRKEHFKIGIIHNETGIIPLDCVLDITLNHTIAAYITHYVGITKLFNTISEVGGYHGYETNITSSSDLISDYLYDDIFKSCFFQYKESTGKPLLILCKSLEENEGLISKNSTKEIVYNLDAIHHLYSFRIQPFSLNGKFIIKGKGTDVKLLFPEKLDFTNQDSIIINYIMTNPYLANNIKFNSEMSELTCNNYYGLKRCIVPKEHFMLKESNHSFISFITLHSNHAGLLSQYYESAGINVIFPKENYTQIFIYIKEEDNKRTINIGNKGIIYFLSDYICYEENIFNSSDIEEKSEFKTSITGTDLNNYNVTCKLWMAINDKIRLFCRFDADINFDKATIKLNSATFVFKNYRIIIKSEMNYSVNLIKINTTKIMPFIYNNKQIIDVGNQKDFYEIKFRYLEYNKEKIILSKKNEKSYYILLDECNFENNDIFCKINKNKIEEILSYSGEIFELKYFDVNVGQLFSFENVLDIKFNYNLIQKENIYIEIQNLLDNNIQKNNYITYKTNISNINNIISNQFTLTKNDSTEMSCLLKKTIDQPLYLLCKAENEGKYSLAEIKQEIILDNINIKYNLLIQPGINNNIFNINGQGGSIIFSFPMILDFYLDDSLFIYFYTKDNEYINEIKLNPDANEDLICDNINNMKKCLVPKNHFDEKNNKYYYIYYKNIFNNFIKFYELSPIEVILPETKEIIIKINNINNNKTIDIGQKGALSFITEFKDPQNIFDISDIEEKTLFNAIFIDIDNEYKAQCHLWKPKEEKLKLICKFEENIINQKIKMNKYSFDYKSYKVTILFMDYLTINQLNYYLSFLYSDKQEINIDDKSNEYNLVFKKEIYNKEHLILYNDNTSMKNTYLNCKEEEKEIICVINKEKILEILSFSGEKFYLSQLIDSQGILPFNEVFEIKINYPNVIKKDIYINLTKIIDMTDANVYFLTPYTEDNSFAIFETNVTKIDKITTNYFKIITLDNKNSFCFLKKNNNKNQKDDKLYLFCDVDFYTYLGIFTIKITELIELNNINIVYNFKIIPSQKLTVFISGKKGTKILSVYPELLDFSSKKDNYTIIFQTKNPEKLENIKLNKDSTSELQCIDKKDIKECTVNKNHFKVSGYHYVYHNNSYGKMLKLYEIPMINVILDKNKDGDDEGSSSNLAGVIVGSIFGALAVIGIGIFIFLRYYKRKNMNNEKKDNKIELI